MSGVENVMKVNKLAQDLLNQGVASSREEAVKKAEQMLDTNIVNSDIINDGHEQQAVPSSNHDANVQSTPQQNNEDQGNDNQKNSQVSDNNEDMLKQMYDFVKKQFAVHKDNISTLNSQLQELRSEIESIRSQQSRQDSAIKQAQQQSRSQEMSDVKDTQQSSGSDTGSSSESSETQQEKPPHPRVGNNKSNEEVSIEKMFYYGR